MNRARRGGFTLIEVTVALVVGGMALSAAAALYQGLSSRAEAIRTAAVRVDRDANAERLVRGIWANLRQGTDSTASIKGDSATIYFKAWCPTTELWMSPCSGRLAIEREDSGFAIRLRLDTPAARPLTLWTGLSQAKIRYLSDAAQGGQWQSSWSQLVTPPAIALVAGADTMILAGW